MSYCDNYQKYLSEVPSIIDSCQNTGQRVAFGYTSNLDIVFRYNADAFNQLVQDQLNAAPSVQEGETIASLHDLARICAAYMISGEGGEIDITDYEVCNYLNEHFEGVPGLGGTGAQGAAALAAMGMPLIAHTTDHCRPVCEIMNYPGLSVIQDGRQVPIIEAASEDTPVYHMILQYTKDDTFHAQEQTYTVPCSNRLIMDYDKIHKDFEVDAGFRQYLEEHAKQIVSYNISGFNAIIDPDVIQKRFAELDSHYRKVKENNPDCIFYFESAHYLNPKVKHLVYDTMAKYVDILGMNEEELVVHTREIGAPIDKSNFQEVLRGLDMVQKKHGAKGIILHTKDYSMYYGTELKGINIEKGLTLGNLMSGTRAQIGQYGTQKDCEQLLNLPLSPTGLKFAEELEAMELPQYTCLVPSRYMEKPKYTIGLGDTFVAGVQMAFVQTKDPS